MTAAAPSNFEVIRGNTARALNGLGAPTYPDRAADPGRRTRTPLSLVANTEQKRRAPFAIFCFLTLVAALMVVLVLNVSVSSGQYDLVQLRAKQAELLKSNQDLTQQVQNAEAPQNLVSRATELGMVTASSMGQINVDTMAVSGHPKPATTDDKPLSVIAAPAVNGARKSGAAAAPAPAPAAASEAMVPPTATSHVSTPRPDAAKTPAAKTPAQPALDLHGGTIPAPEQKNG